MVEWDNKWIWEEDRTVVTYRGVIEGFYDEKRLFDYLFECDDLGENKGITSSWPGGYNFRFDDLGVSLKCTRVAAPDDKITVQAFCYKDEGRENLAKVVAAIEEGRRQAQVQ